MSIFDNDFLFKIFIEQVCDAGVDNLSQLNKLFRNKLIEIIIKLTDQNEVFLAKAQNKNDIIKQQIKQIKHKDIINIYHSSQSSIFFNKYLINSVIDNYDTSKEVQKLDQLIQSNNNDKFNQNINQLETESKGTSIPDEINHYNDLMQIIEKFSKETFTCEFLFQSYKSIISESLKIKEKVLYFIENGTLWIDQIDHEFMKKQKIFRMRNEKCVALGNAFSTEDNFYQELHQSKFQPQGYSIVKNENGSHQRICNRFENPIKMEIPYQEDTVHLNLLNQNIDIQVGNGQIQMGQTFGFDEKACHWAGFTVEIDSKFLEKEFSIEMNLEDQEYTSNQYFIDYSISNNKYTSQQYKGKHDLSDRDFFQVKQFNFYIRLSV